MTTIKDILDKNRSTLDHIELPEGHRERMQARLAAAARKSRRRHIALWISSASAVAAVIALALWIVPISNNAPQPQLAQIKIDTTKLTPITTPTVDTTTKIIVAQVKTQPKPSVQKKQTETTKTARQSIIDEIIEIEEVERYYQAQRDETIESVETLLYDKDPTEIARIKRDLTILTEGFKSDTLPKSLLTRNPEQYVAMTIDRLIAQREIINRLKSSIANI